MQSSTRLWYCRCAFLLFCLAPTVLVGTWIARRASGGYVAVQKAEWERSLSDRLGLLVSIQTIASQSPGVVRLENVSFLEPESRRVIAQVQALDCAATNGGWQIDAFRLQVDAEQLSKIRRALDERILRAHGELPTCDFSASELTVTYGSPTDSGPAQTLIDCAARLEMMKEGPHLTFSFQLPAGRNQLTNPTVLTVARDRSSSPAATHWQLNTGETALPCALLAEAIPPLVRLGRDGRFAGSVVMANTTGGMSGKNIRGELNGTFFGVDLDSLVTEQFPHQLSGIAALRLDRAAVENGRLVELRGTLQAQHGAVSHSMLLAASEHLGLELVKGFETLQAGRVMPFGQLTVGFELTGHSLRLTGGADETGNRILLANATGPVLLARPQHSTPAVNLLRTLLPDNHYQVPATRQSDALIGLLPMPDVVPVRTASAPGHMPARLSAVPPAAAAPAIRQPRLR